jgi:hypothetical protein
MKYNIEYKTEPIGLRELNDYCEENQCELVTIVKDDYGMYAHYFRLI